MNSFCKINEIEIIITDFIFKEIDLITENNIVATHEFILLSYAIQNSLTHFLDIYYGQNDTKNYNISNMKLFLEKEIIFNKNIIHIPQTNDIIIFTLHQTPKEIDKINGNSIIKFLYFSVKYLPIFFCDFDMKISSISEKVKYYKEIINSSIEEFKVSYSHNIINSSSASGLIENIFFSKVELLIQNK